ncbi:MAG: hypothetical protein ACK40O_09555 [Allosphingosinicella sp.]
MAAGDFTQSGSVDPALSTCARLCLAPGCAQQHLEEQLRRY